MTRQRVIATAVVRSAHQGESHGGVYLIDLKSGNIEQVVDWAININWQGRGFDRGLRGIAFHGGLTYIASSAAILVYNESFEKVATFENPYLRHCHEIDIDGDTLWATSTGFDTILAIDLKRQRFVRGFHLRYGRLRNRLKRIFPVGLPRLVSFDPNGEEGPKAADTLHLNTVLVHDGLIYCSGTGLNRILHLDGERLSGYARIPFRTHNARPYQEGVLMNHTEANKIRYADRAGQVREQWRVPIYEESRLLNNKLPREHARQGFGRGLCTTDAGEILAGSSPATLSRYERGDPQPKQSINLTMDVRYAIHGLEVYPY
jgi:hypothetical protein